MLAGYKTYIAAFGFVAFGAAQAALGDMPGAMNAFLQAAGLFGLRQAIGRP